MKCGYDNEQDTNNDVDERARDKRHLRRRGHSIQPKQACDRDAEQRRQTAPCVVGLHLPRGCIGAVDSAERTRRQRGRECVAG